MKERQIEQQRVADELEILQAARRVEPAPIVQINQIMEEWRNEDIDALDLKNSRIEMIMEIYMWIEICKKMF